MSVRMRHTRAHSANRRSHHGLKSPRLSTCAKCAELHLRHRMCENCGTYKEVEVVDVLAKTNKKLERAKAKNKALGREPIDKKESEESKPLSAEELSK